MTTAVGVSKEHITKTPGVCGGRACVAGHRIRVLDIVARTRDGQSPAQITAKFPGITESDVYSALAYYHDHPAEIDAEFEADRKLSELGAKQPSRIRDALARNPMLAEMIAGRRGAAGE